MFPVKFVIHARKTDGEEFVCFNWSRDEISGIQRAWSDAKMFDIDITDVWAVPYV